MTMKHNWEYKRLGDLCNFIGGGTPSKSNEDYFNGNIPWATVRDMLSFQLSDTELHITSDAVNNSATNILPKGMIIISTHVGLGKICELMQETAINQDLKGISFFDNSVDKYFFVYWYRSIANYIISKGRGATVKGVTLDFMRSLQIPVPTMEVQKQIVEELDKINEIIEDCRELLRNLDVLAQSLFYDLFGDPISNPKGFKLKKLGEIDEISSAKRVLVQDVVDKGIPFIRGTELACLSKQNSFDPSVFTMFITPEHYEIVKSITGVPKPHDLLLPSINADGYIWEINTPEPLYFKDGRVLWVHVNHGVHSSKWLKFALSKIIKEKYANLSRGAVFAELTLVFLRNLDIIVPPLSLQEKFATQVEQIEVQKKTVEEMIANLQTLLDSRMDYWFN